MSKETIHYACGHTGTENLVGNRKDRARRAKWLGENRVCPDCDEKERAAANAAAAVANAAAGLPPLEGSEKQAAWAESIRKRMLAELDTAAPVVDLQRQILTIPAADRPEFVSNNADVARSLSYELQEMLNELRAPERYDAFAALMRGQTDAAWWIDCRGGLADVAKLHRKMIDSAVRAAQEAPEEKAAARKAIQEATIRPAGDPVSLTIAEIRNIANAIEVVFPEKRDDFREQIKMLGYAWKESCWHKSLDGTTGNAVDRLAEVAHRLVASGFVVRLHNTTAREKAISGQFEPEQTRWVLKIVSGKHAGWLLIKWGHADDLYSVARSLPGARYVRPHVVVPAGAIEAVAEFADKYGFAMSASVNDILEAHRAALAGGAVVTSIVDRPVAVRDDYDGTPKPLAAPDDADIDDDLKD